MKTHASSRIALGASLCSGLLMVLDAPCRAGEPAPQALDGVGIDQRLDAEVPLDLAFLEESGGRVELRDYFARRRPVILCLVYYKCPMLCTLVLNGLLRCLRVLSFDVGKEFEVVTVSFDPRESPSLAAKKKTEYIAEYGRKGAESGWHFLTGEEGRIRRLAEAVGFRYAYDPATGQYAHASAIMILTPRGRVARYFFGVEYSTRDLRLGLVEAAEERIGSPVDQLLLYCFQYDPARGKYSFAIIGALRLASVATLLALSVFVFRMLLRDRRRSEAARFRSREREQDTC